MNKQKKKVLFTISYSPSVIHKACDVALENNNFPMNNSHVSFVNLYMSFVILKPNLAGIRGDGELPQFMAEICS